MIYSDFLDDDALSAYVQAINSRAKRLGIKQCVSSAQLRDRIFASGGQCGWCQCDLVGQAFEIDHIIGLSKGGANTPQNLTVSCPDCNRRKAARHPAAFAQETAARTGIITPLIQRVLDHYEMDIRVQRGLFDEAQSAEDTAPRNTDDTDTTADDDPPPYVWGR